MFKLTITCIKGPDLMWRATCLLTILGETPKELGAVYSAKTRGHAYRLATAWVRNQLVFDGPDEDGT